MKTSIVLGLCFGDEGKGLVTSCLSNPGELVVRFNGGQQAGHTVEKDGYRHVFSQFGSGTLNKAHTYISEYCTFYPNSFVREGEMLKSKGRDPAVYIHPLTMITTPFDIDHNRSCPANCSHGTVGMGFGSTIARHTTSPYKLYASDLFYMDILEHKLNQIADYYKVTEREEEINRFILNVERAKDMFFIQQLRDIKDYYSSIVFEGAQGIMLDMDHGFFPNVTRSNTTSKNAMKLIKENGLAQPDIYYCMRSYLTRHGNGYMPNEEQFNFEDQTNKSHKYQGIFRQGYHSSQMLNHALLCDSAYSNGCRLNLVITCLNQTSSSLLIDQKEEPIEYFIQRKWSHLNLYTSYSKEMIQSWKKNKQLHSPSTEMASC